MQEISFFKHFLPVIMISKILGTAPMSYSQCTITFSKFGVVQTLIYFVIFVTLTVTFFKEQFSIIPNELINVRTIAFATTFRIVANIVLMTILFAGTCISTKHFLNILKQMRKMEHEFLKLDKINSIQKTDKQNRKTLIFLIVLSLVFDLLADLLTLAVKEGSLSILKEISTFVITVYPRLVINNINSTFFNVLMILEGRFKVINNVLNAQIDESKKIQKYPTDAGFCEKTQHLVTLHKYLIKIAKDCNSIFSLHLLVWITVTFILLVGDLYIVMYIFFFHLSEIQISLILFLMKNTLMYSLELFLLSKFVTNLCQEVSITFVIFFY